MADVPQIVLPHGGYRKLMAFQKSEVVYQMTVLFCRRFLPAHGDRTVDQMTQAARSCKQNIAEGSASSGTNKETELKLTNVARASLDELLEDYLDYLKAHDSSLWTMHDERAVTAKRLGREHSDWKYWRPIFASRPAEVCCNLAITLIHQTRSLMDSLIKHLEADFVKHGGIRERMHAARTAARGEDWDKSLYSRLNGASTVAELEARAEEIRRKVSQSVWGIKKRKGWQ
jgi:four helix bundle suffix protein